MRSRQSTAAFLAVVVVLLGLLGLSIPDAHAGDRNELSLYLQGTRALSDFEALPSAPAVIEQKHLHAPAVVGMDFEVGSEKGAFFGDLHAAWLGYTASPAFGLALGPVIRVGVADLKLLLEIETNGGLDSKVQDSFLSATRWGLGGDLALVRGMLRPSLGLRWLNLSSTQISNQENLPTKVAHDATYVLKAGLLLKLPVLQAEGALSIYSLGKTAISSKEFAYASGRQTALRPSVGVGVDLLAFEFWLRGAAVYPTRSDDSVEYLYMAPFYVNDNLMTKRSLTAEARIKW